MSRQKMGSAMALAALVSVFVVACSSSSPDDAVDDPTTTEAVDDPTTSAPAPSDDADAPGLDGLRGVRYCEVLLVNRDEDGFSADVWNTLGLNDCPQQQWEALDAEAVAAERDALAAILNGPRYWVLDRISATQPASDRPQTTFGDLDMFLAASVNLGTEAPNQDAYVERTVARDTVFGFDAGSEVYELTDPDGTVYVMQAYSQIVDPDLSEEDLAGLGSVIEPPDGWTFATRVLDEPLDVASTDGIATVVQDELANTYQRIDG